MISNAFKGAYTNEVSQQNQTISNVSSGIKAVGGAALATLGFTGGTGKVIKDLAKKVGGLGGGAMQAVLDEKKTSAETKEEAQKLFTSEEVASTIESQLGDNPINRAAKKQLNTVFETLQMAKEEKIINKKGQIETDLGPVDPNSELGKQILSQLKEEDKEPNIEKGYTRLYRGLENEYDPNYKGRRDNPEGYESWTNNKDLAKKYGENVYYIDIKNEDIAESYLDENPKSETYGDRNYIYKNIGKKVGLDNVSGDEYLLYTEHEKHPNTKYRKL